MRKDDLTRLRHMIDFAKGALRFAEHRSRGDLARAGSDLERLISTRLGAAPLAGSRAER